MNFQSLLFVKNLVTNYTLKKLFSYGIGLLMFAFSGKLYVKTVPVNFVVNTVVHNTVLCTTKFTGTVFSYKTRIRMVSFSHELTEHASSYYIRHQNCRHKFHI